MIPSNLSIKLNVLLLEYRVLFRFTDMHANNAGEKKVRH